MPPISDVSTSDVPSHPGRTVHRPPMKRAEPYSSALNGMERTVTRIRIPKSTTIEAIIDMYGERPLPPVPRIPSSIYASSKRGTVGSLASPVSPESPGAVAFPPSPATVSPLTPSTATSSPSASTPITPLRIKAIVDKDSKSARHLSQLFRKDTKRTPRAADASPLRHNFTQKPKAPGNPKQKTNEIKPTPFTEWQPPAYKEPSASSKSSPRSPVSQRSASFDCPRPSLLAGKTAEGRAASYFALIDPRNPNSGRKSRRLSSPQAQSPTLPISDVKGAINQRIVPYPIRTNSLPDTPPQSHFSPSSPSASDLETTGVAASLRSRAKKLLPSSKKTKRPGLKWMNSSQSDISCASSITAPASSTIATSPQRNSMQQSLSDVYDTLEKMSTRSRGGIKRPGLLRGDHFNPLMKKKSSIDLRSQAMSSTEQDKNDRNNQEAPKSQPYVYRPPRKRLSKPPMPAILMAPTAKGPDTTYKIEMPPPETPQRPDTVLFFGDSYHVETPSPQIQIPDILRPANPINPNRTSTIKYAHLSHSSSSSTSLHRLSHRVSKVEKHRLHRRSLPVSAHSRQNSDENNNTTSSPTHQNQNTDASNSVTAKQSGRPVGQKWIASLPMLGLGTPVLEVERGAERGAERGRHPERKEGGRRESAAGSSLSAERRREALKKRIRVMGDPSAVGIPF